MLTSRALALKPRRPRPTPPRRSLRICPTRRSALGAAACGISAVVWCTGFNADFSWLRLPGGARCAGRSSAREGHYRLAGDLLHRPAVALGARSALVTGVALDAPRIAALVGARCR